MKYAILTEYFPEVEKKLNRIAKKCAKHGNPFVFKIDGEEIREKKVGKEKRCKVTKKIIA